MFKATVLWISMALILLPLSQVNLDSSSPTADIGATHFVGSHNGWGDLECDSSHGALFECVGAESSSFFGHDYCTSQIGISITIGPCHPDRRLTIDLEHLDYGRWLNTSDLGSGYSAKEIGISDSYFVISGRNGKFGSCSIEFVINVDSGSSVETIQHQINCRLDGSYSVAFRGYDNTMYTLSLTIDGSQVVTDFEIEPGLNWVGQTGSESNQISPSIFSNLFGEWSSDYNLNLPSKIPSLICDQSDGRDEYCTLEFLSAYAPESTDSVAGVIEYYFEGGAAKREVVGELSIAQLLRGGFARDYHVITRDTGIHSFAEAWGVWQHDVPVDSVEGSVLLFIPLKSDSLYSGGDPDEWHMQTSQAQDGSFIAANFNSGWCVHIKKDRDFLGPVDVYRWNEPFIHHWSVVWFKVVEDGTENRVQPYRSVHDSNRKLFDCPSGADYCTRLHRDWSFDFDAKVAGLAVEVSPSTGGGPDLNQIDLIHVQLKLDTDGIEDAASIGAGVYEAGGIDPDRNWVTGWFIDISAPSPTSPEENPSDHDYLVELLIDDPGGGGTVADPIGLIENDDSHIMSPHEECTVSIPSNGEGQTSNSELLFLDDGNGVSSIHRLIILHPYSTNTYTISTIHYVLFNQGESIPGLTESHVTWNLDGLVNGESLNHGVTQMPGDGASLFVYIEDLEADDGNQNAEYHSVWAVSDEGENSMPYTPMTDDCNFFSGRFGSLAVEGTTVHPFAPPADQW